MAWSGVPTTYLGAPLECVRNSSRYWTESVKNLKRRADMLKPNHLSVFGRATACNIFLVAKLWYVLQVIHCARGHLQRFHRIFATFIWDSSWEPMRRDNLFRSIEAGGLGLTHLFVRKIVSRFMFLRTSSHPFIRTFLQTHLMDLLPDLVVSSDHVAMPRPFGFLKEVVEAFEFLKVRFSLDYLFTVSRKELYHNLIDSLFPDPLYRSHYPNSTDQDVLKRVRRMRVPPTAKTFFFKLHTNTLPVKPWLRDKGIFVPWSVNCRLCNTPETIEHCFIFCTDAYLFWDVLQRTIKKDLYINTYSIRFLPVEDPDTFPADFFILLGMHSLWKTRMIDRNAEPPRTTKSNFIETCNHVISVLDELGEKPRWYWRLEKCLSFPDF
ncbi:uncharacterized protein LOC120836770 [Ixodes scapularis]|uniref:uncharacterized protein LOC120836770 n=1 Tax=Ixodes scapularis TaxID=6945 RepID=UPI001AD72003|nr:uncharacterized protein LOC120836770 [Ixodes scapularis]